MQSRFERVVVPVTGTASDERVLTVVTRLAAGAPVAVTLLYVVAVAQSMPLDAELPEEIARGEAALRQGEAIARRALGGKGAQIATELLQARSVGAAVVDEAIERGADAIVLVATVGRKHGQPTMGETVNYIMLNAACEVVVIRQAPPETARTDRR